MHNALSDFHEISHPLNRKIVLVGDKIIHEHDDFLLKSDRIFLREKSMEIK